MIKLVSKLRTKPNIKLIIHEEQSSFMIKTSTTNTFLIQQNKKMSSLPNPQGYLCTGCTDIMIGRSKEGTLMRLFYPTSLTAIKECKNQWASWFLGDQYTEGIAKFIFPPFPSIFSFLFNWQTKTAKIPCVWEAPLANGRFPLIVFSHGLSGHRSLYSSVCTDLASHGFVVAALEHRDESACGTFTLSKSGEKEWIPFKILEKNVKEYPLRSQQVKIRSLECTRALDVMISLSSGENLKNELPSSFDLKSLKNKVDVSHPIISGHSFGGAATILTLSKDKRFQTGILLDPWMFPLKDDLDQLKKSITQPMLIILTEAFQNKPNFKAFASIDVPLNQFVTLKGSVHQNQSDTPFLFGYIAKILGGVLSDIDPHLAISLNNQLMINFINKRLDKLSQGHSLDLELAQESLQLGLSLTPASMDETIKLLNRPDSKSVPSML